MDGRYQVEGVPVAVNGRQVNRWQVTCGEWTD